MARFRIPDVLSVAASTAGLERRDKFPQAPPTVGTVDVYVDIARYGLR